MRFNFFQEDIKGLAKETGGQESFAKVHSLINKLDPFIDKGGILHVGGWLEHTDTPDKVKHPVNLPKNMQSHNQPCCQVLLREN